jgi:hypothetical protein
MKTTAALMMAILLACFHLQAAAGDRERYNHMASARYVRLFNWADRNGDGIVSRSEAIGSVELQSKFDDIDIDRDGELTWAELERYVLARFATDVNRVSLDVTADGVLSIS